MQRPTARPTRLLPLLLCLTPLASSSSAAAASSVHGGRKRRRRPAASARTAPRLFEANSEEAVRERWVDLLSLDEQLRSNNDRPVRSANGRERRRHDEAEALADRLLGYDAPRLLQTTSSLRRASARGNSLLSAELALLWKAIAVASSGLLLGLPLAALIGSIASSPWMQQLVGSVQSSIAPYLLPTFDVASHSLRHALLQGQAVVHSLPYLLRHLNRVQIRPLPFLYKLIRKCLIIEAWRHIWTRVYKATRYIWKGTLRNAKAGYVRWCPAWIRRGVKSMFQSMVQAHVHGVVGGAVGSALSGVTFESWAWSSPGGEEGTSSAIMEESAMGDAVVDAMSESAAPGVEAAVQEALLASTSAEGAMEAMAEGADAALGDAVESMADAMAESADAAVESMADAMAESADAAVDAAVESMAEGAMDGMAEGMEDVVEAIVDDCLSEGCLDELVESVVSE